MSASILITGNGFYNEYKNGVGFVSNLGDFTKNLTGSVMENVKCFYQLDVSWQFFAGDANPLPSIIEISPTVLKMSLPMGKKWSNESFAIGDDVLITWTDFSGAQNNTAQVTSVTANVMVLVWSGLPIIGNLNGWINNSTKIYGTTPLTAMVYKFGLNDNGIQDVDPQSAVSSNDQGYYGSNIGFDTGGGIRDTNWNTLIRLGQYKGWKTGSMRVKFDSNPATLHGEKISQRFTIEHEFMIVPYYLDGELSNLQNNIIPPFLAGLNSIKYTFSPGFRTVLNDPNTEKRIKYFEELGSVAWYNENFNGFQNQYKILSVTYTEQATTNSADGILIASKTRIQIQVQALNRNFVSGDKVGVYVSYLPSESEYQNTFLTDLKENFIYDNAFQGSGAAGATGQDFITQFDVFSPFGNLMTLKFDVDYSVAQKLRLANLHSQQPIFFVIGVELGDNSLPSGNADRLILLADAKEYDESADIPDLMDVVKYDIYPHNAQIPVGGTTDLTGWIEDGIAIDYEFELDLNRQALLNQLDSILFAYDPLTKIYFELDKYSFNIFPATVSVGVQQLSLAATRGYILLPGDQFNDVTINTGAQALGIQKYDGRVAHKFSWQDWLLNLGVDTIFYDVTKPQNNFNFKTSNYSLLKGYEIRVGFFANLFGVNSLNVSGITDYLFPSPTLTVYDYTKDGLPIPVWTHLIETFDATATTNLGGAILTGQDTFFRTTWTHSGGPVTSLVNLWGIHRIEETNQPGFVIAEMSSLNLPLPTGQQLLKPTGILTLLDITIVSGQVVLECLIDGSLVQSGKNYNLSTRIQDDNVVIGAGKQKSPSGDLKQKGGSSDVKQKAP